MTRKITIITCFVSAAIICGCQDKDSSDSADQSEDGSIEVHNNTGTETSEENSRLVIAYYFHRTTRCPACLEIETAAQRVIITMTEQIGAGQLVWIPLNLDEPGGEKFEKEFDVSVSTLVVAEVQGGNHTRYKELEKVWDYIGDPVKFNEYVRTEVKQFLNE